VTISKAELAEATRTGKHAVRILSYNMFLRPALVNLFTGMRDGSVCRAPRLGAKLKRMLYDVVALQETQHQEGLQLLLNKVGDRYPYRILAKPEAFAWSDTRVVDGGVSLLSRYPIEFWTAVPYSACTGIDCLARKGFIHAVLRLSPRLSLNVIATHAQSGSRKEAQDVRTEQFKQLAEYLKTSEIIERWPTVITGDLNVDGLILDPTTREEYQAMTETLTLSLGAPVDAFNMFPLVSEVDSWTNTRACLGSQVVPCRLPIHTLAKEERRRLDYVIFYKHPSYKIDSLNRDVVAFEDPELLCGTPYLSDHKAVGLELNIQASKIPSKSYAKLDG